MSKNVLVCDDEYFIRWALSEHLRTVGYQVVEAENGLECLQRVEESAPDAILLDVRMPKMDGLTALKTLRAKGIQTPVYILSSFGSPSSSEDAIALGANGLIPKPFHLSDMTDLLAELFREAV